MALRADEDVDVLLVDLDAPCPCAAVAPPTAPPHRHRWRRRLAEAAVVAVLAAVVLSSLLAPPQPVTPGSAGAVTDQQPFAVLAQPQEPGAAALPPGLSATTGLRAGSERLLAETPDASLWVARGGGDRLCLVVAPSRAGRAHGSSCAPPSVAAGGLQVTTAAGLSAVLLPVGSDAAAPVRAGFAQLAPGVWVDARTAERAAVSEVRSPSPLTVALPVEAHRGSAPLPVMLTEPGARYVVVLSCLQPALVHVSLVGLAGEPSARTCPTGAPVLAFTARGRLAQVAVQVPDDVVWAAEVVEA